MRIVDRLVEWLVSPVILNPYMSGTTTTLPPVPVRMGQRVRLVRMDGCMAHVRNDIREGTVVGFAKKNIYGSDRIHEYVQIKLDDNRMMERLTDPSLWIVHEGVAEYHE